MEEISRAKTAREITELSSQHSVSPLCTFPLPQWLLRYLWNTGSQPTDCDPRTGVACQIFILQFLTVGKFQLCSITKMILWLGVTTTQGIRNCLRKVESHPKEHELQRSQPHDSLHRHNEDTPAHIIVVLTITKLYAEYLKRRKASLNSFCYFILL